jgi:glycosyltransferase involved in cell wall biosynthesis
MPKFSICIPTYEMHGEGVNFLSFSLKRLAGQTFKDFEVVISDHSMDDEVMKCAGSICHEADMKLLYIRNDKGRGSSSVNINCAMDHAQGEWIKPLFQDDFLLAPDSLKKINDAIVHQCDETLGWCNWLATGTGNYYINYNIMTPTIPSWNDRMHLGINSIGSPSAVAMRNIPELPRFDNELIWLMDCEYYRRLHDLWGSPLIIPEMIAVNAIWGRQLTYTISNERKRDECIKMRNKYGVA